MILDGDDGENDEILKKHCLPWLGGRDMQSQIDEKSKKVSPTAPR